MKKRLTRPGFEIGIFHAENNEKFLARFPAWLTIISWCFIIKIKLFLFFLYIICIGKFEKKVQKSENGANDLKKAWV